LNKYNKKIIERLSKLIKSQACHANIKGQSFLLNPKNHYQKFAKYQRLYRRNIFCQYFEVKITDGHFPSVIQSVTTDKKFPSVFTDWITDGKVFEFKKRRVADVGVLAVFFSDRITDGFKNDCPYSARKVMRPVRRLNFRRTHRGIWNGRSVRWHVYVSVRITDGHSVGKTVGKS